jgi:PleD family two-component response regulator
MNDADKVCRAFSLGVHAYLLKPIQHLYLSAAVERCLQESSAMRQKEPRKPPQLFLLPSAIPARHANLVPNFKS